MEPVEAAEALTNDLAPAQRLTPQQRATLLAYARTGTIEGAAAVMGLSAQTAKNHLSVGYRRLGVKSGPQAIYLLMGGENVLRDLPPALPAHRRAAQRRVRHLRMPSMIDGEITLRDLRDAARLGDADTTEPKASFTELVDWLAYYIHPPGWRPRAPSTG